jgi:hypothetical protein
MSFECPGCSRPDSLEIQASINLPPDSRSDEIAFQVLVCSRCGFRGLAVYEESRRGAFGAETWDHAGYRVGAPLVERVENLILSCLDPRNELCTCPAHQELGRVDNLGRWQYPGGIEGASSFPMRLSRLEA